MLSTDFSTAMPAPNHIIACPNCGGEDYEDNRVDEALYREAAREAPRLRFEGKTDDALEVLTALYAIRIANFLAPQFCCCACAATFDA